MQKNRIVIAFSLIMLCCGLVNVTYAQGGWSLLKEGQKLNTVGAAVTFTMLSPDARSGAMGDVGVSSSPDANSMHWNPAKYAFIDSELGFAVNYTPWMRSLVNDINLAHVSGFKRLDKYSTFAASLTYFSLGDITFTSETGENLGIYRPNEFTIDGTYARKFSEKISGAVAGRFIYSNLTQGQDVGGASTHAGISVAADVAMYYTTPIDFNTMSGGSFNFGVNISNIGSKISYSDANTDRDFIPTNLRIGPSLTMDIDDYNRLTVMIDFNKLLIPTPPQYYLDSFNLDNEPVVKYGMDPNVSVVQGMLQSFYDAPGYVDELTGEQLLTPFREELRELQISAGLEYWYDKQFALRGGYFFEHATKGGRQYFTVGAGLKYNVFGLDFSYLIPIGQRNPLENTLRFSLLFDFDAFQDQNRRN
ncbi:MAG: type IX secretion system outer membrane channel protein PorV [Bacteroidales bacterium]|nr:type IX secretion system outer membrane channel protein PorV [Bacteroidales bacterium]MDD3010402.1 type IX secretion system outer membrane channel protein PorV [Bacteroidales bacterium]MDD3961179.1 type IX secretion system outer membrane channel protein PorV [Bacteroidales bacterium]MDY0284603.1 type IX secretion system outer membrane channel protein PorV [Bacteroidales bacterium]HPE85770.1 type IX secretion system outer membrane channel protein PorV [Bacteroidales bacterium]